MTLTTVIKGCLESFAPCGFHNSGEVHINTPRLLRKAYLTSDGHLGQDNLLFALVDLQEVLQELDSTNVFLPLLTTAEGYSNQLYL